MSKLSKKKFLEKLYRDNKQLMYKTAYSVLHNHEQAEDAVQEAFLRVIKNFSRFSSYSCNENTSYLVIIVRGISLNMLAANKRTAELFDDLPAADNIEETALVDIAYEQIVRNIEKLSPALKNIATMLWVGNLSEGEIAELLDMNINTVRSSAARARKQLKQMLTEEFYNDK
ncbi:MAG: sigma-70 family RNA polymerase sigma factor [Lachnospiraceae bacterium]|nr:sigma-70 family RNA polymerase sigma factor [Ruminococcus sp.]MCM1276940.1 sigma-70 family RNA polymerase sigma factor [Lachnospiraceae bacterium]